nr:unnamed protein product [Digitaria exilis]
MCSPSLATSRNREGVNPSLPLLRWAAELGVSDSPLPSSPSAAAAPSSSSPSSCIGRSLVVADFPDAGGSGLTARGLAAARDLRRGELVLRVPRAALFTSDRVMTDDLRIAACIGPFATTSPRRSFRSMTLERGLSIVRDDRAMSVTIELSSSFRHDSRPHDRTLEAPTFRHARGSAAKLEESPSSDVPARSRLRSQARALTLERRSVTLEAPQPSSSTYPRATFRHPRGFAAKLEGGTHPRVAFPTIRGSASSSLRSSSKRRSAWSKCLVQARKLCPTPQTPTFNFTRFEVQFEFLEKIRIWKSELHGHATVPLARAALAGARPPRGAELAKPRRTLALVA